MPMLRLIFKRGFSDEALQAVEIRAMAIIRFNWENPRLVVPPTFPLFYPWRMQYIAMAGG